MCPNFHSMIPQAPLLTDPLCFTTKQESIEQSVVQMSCYQLNHLPTGPPSICLNKYLVMHIFVSYFLLLDSFPAKSNKGSVYYPPVSYWYNICAHVVVFLPAYLAKLSLCPPPRDMVCILRFLIFPPFSVISAVPNLKANANPVRFIESLPSRPYPQG